MIRILSLARSTYDTTSTRRPADYPTLRNRCSAIAWSGSEMVTSNGSPNTVEASPRISHSITMEPGKTR